MRFISILAEEEADTGNLMRVDSVLAPERCALPEDIFAVTGADASSSTERKHASRAVIVLCGAFAAT